jgi:hypothetical protein
LLPDFCAEIEIRALHEGNLLGLQDVVQALVHVLEETLRCCLQQEDLRVVVLVVRQVTTLLAHQLLVHHAISYVAFVMVRAGSGITR